MPSIICGGTQRKGPKIVRPPACGQPACIYVRQARARPFGIITGSVFVTRARASPSRIMQGGCASPRKESREGGAKAAPAGAAAFFILCRPLLRGQCVTRLAMTNYTLCVQCGCSSRSRCFRESGDDMGEGADLIRGWNLFFPFTTRNWWWVGQVRCDWFDDYRVVVELFFYYFVGIINKWTTHIFLIISC